MLRIKLPSHQHYLYPTPWVRRCHACGRNGGYRKDGYRCYECSIFLHKECAESSIKINHPSHPQHSLHLYITQTRYDFKNCTLCGQACYHVFYHCRICYFFVDTVCAKNPPQDAIEHPKTHQHSLILLKNHYNGKCYFCKERYCDRFFYECSQCELKFHFECSIIPLEITHPCHSKHLLKYLLLEEHHFSDGKCRICGDNLGQRFYHCAICKFSLDVGCARNPPPLEILFDKAHEHQLSLLPRNITFSCDACGANGDRSPYSCHQCDFMIHQSCIDLPEIIYNNRHEHRISRCLHLSPGTWVCGVCHQNVDWSFGAYSCSICPKYAIHSGCAIRDDVWDKLELKGIPEEIEEIEPFTTIQGNVIYHFSHEKHYLSLNEGDIIYRGSVRCAACVSPINSKAFYNCMNCDFILHKTCANLPRKKRHVYHDKPLTLVCGDMTRFRCSACSQYSTGFSFSAKDFSIDVKCGSLSEVIFHESHPCPLYYIYGNRKTCSGCEKWSFSTFSCDECKFALDFSCVVLPKTTKHWYDKHLLSLCYEKATSGQHWCDICERNIDTRTWFYKCDICCATFDINCVLSDFSFLILGRLLTDDDGPSFEVMQTKPSFLPRCYVCRSQRAFPFVIKVYLPKKCVFICSHRCYFRTSYICQDLY